MDPLHQQQLSAAYQGPKHVMYQPPMRGSIQTGMPSMTLGMEVGKSKTVASELSPHGTMGYPPVSQQIAQRSGYPHGYQHPTQHNYPTLSPVATSETSPFRREHTSVPSAAYIRTQGHLIGHKSPTALQSPHRSETQHPSKSYDRLNYGLPNHGFIGNVPQQVPQLERVKPLPSHHSTSVHVKEHNHGVKPGHHHAYQTSAQMHLNYHHDAISRNSAAGHPNFTSHDRRSVTASKPLPGSQLGYSESQRMVVDSRRGIPSNTRNSMPELIRVADDVDPRIPHTIRPQNSLTQTHRASQALRPEHVIPTSIRKDHNRSAQQQKSRPTGQRMMILNQDYSNQKVTTGSRLPHKESTQGSIQTGVPLDLSRVPEKSASVNSKDSRDTDSPLDLSIKTRKRSADTTISQYSSDNGVTSAKRSVVDQKHLSQPSLMQHYRNSLQDRYNISSHHNQSPISNQRQQTYTTLYKEPVTVRADNSAAKSAGLLPMTQEQANIIYQNQKQLSNLKAQKASLGAQLYPYNSHPGSQPSVLRRSPDSTDAQAHQHHHTKQVQQMLKSNPQTQIPYLEQFQHQQQQRHQQKVQSSKAIVRSNAVERLSSINPPIKNQNLTHSNLPPSKSDLSATSKSNASIPRTLLQDGSSSGRPDSNIKSTISHSKSEPHMQLYPSYEKQSFTGPLPSNIHPNKAKNQAAAPNIYKTHVKPPEVMGLPSKGTEKTIVNTIQSISNEIKLEPKSEESKIPLNETASKIQESDSEHCDKYMEPLSIAIPFAKSTSSSMPKSPKPPKSGDDKIIAPAPPKILSRKQMIMNAVIKDENLKKYATPMRKPRHGSEFKAPRNSPASPPSPKMPILSPQQKTLPSVSPLHSDPPTLDLLENPGKQRVKGRISHTIPKRPLDKVKATTLKIPTENQDTLPNVTKEEPKESTYQRPEAIRRNSLPEKTWMYNKNIPVANVAPFVHSEIKVEKLADGTNNTPIVPGSEEQPKSEISPQTDNDQKVDVTAESQSPPNVIKQKKKDKSNTEQVVVKAKLKNISARKKLALEKMKNNMIGPESKIENRKVSANSESDSVKASRKTKTDKKSKSEQPGGPPTDRDVDESGHLMSDPALLDREERALRRAIDQFNKMETGSKYPSSATTVRRQSNTNKRAQQLKKKAIKRNSVSNRNSNSRIIGRSGLRSRSFIDFKPEVLKSRTRPADTKRVRKRPSNRGKSRNERHRPRPQDIDFDYEHDLDFLDDDDDEDEDDDDDEDATEYEYDSEELSQDRVLRKRVSLRTRKRTIRHIDTDDSDTALDYHDEEESESSSKPRTRPRRTQISRTNKTATSSKQDRVQSGESTDEEFDAAYFNRENSSINIPAEVKKIIINKTTGETGLHKAVRLNYQEAVLYYLKSGSIEVNVKDNAGYTPLHEACSTGNLPIARILLQYGADANNSSLDGTRPIHDAVRCDHIEIVRLLLAFGADPTLTVGGGKSLLEISEHPSMTRFLEGYLGDLNGFASDAEENPWQFSSCYDSGPTETGCNIFSDIPSDPENDIDDLFDDDISSAIRIFDLDLYNIGRSESYVYGEDIQSQFNCNETRLRKLCTPEMDVIKLPTEKFQKFFENSVVRCPLTTNPTICLIKYAYYKNLKEKLTPNTKCSNVSDLISYRNKATERKVLNKTDLQRQSDSPKPIRKVKSETKSVNDKSVKQSESRQNKSHNSKYSMQQSSSCPSRVTSDTSEASSSHNNINNNNNNNSLVNNNINNLKKRQSNLSVQVVLKKEMLSSLSGKKSSKLENFKIRTPSTSSSDSKPANSTKSISSVASSKYEFNEDSN